MSSEDNPKHPENPRFRAIIDWVPHSEGGRRAPPRLLVGERYTAPASVGSWSGTNWTVASWSLIVNEVHWMTQYQCAATVQYLFDEAPHDRLVPGAQFELYEGKRCVARGRIHERMAGGAVTRLEQFFPELSRALRSASETRRTTARVTACEMALAHTGIVDEVVVRFLERLRQGERFSAAERAEIDAFVARLDEEYFQLSEAAKYDHARAKEVIQAFAKARAVAAIAVAGLGTVEADEDAIYEATHAMERSGSEMIMRIRKCLECGE